MIFSKPNKKTYISVLTLLLVVITNSCKNNDDTPIVTDIQLNETELTMNVGDEVSLQVTTDTYDNAIIWRSSNENIATVNDQGLVTIMAGGTVAITATVDQAQAICIINSNPDVFIIQREVEDEIPVFWKNGEKTSMGNEIDKILNSIFVYKEDVYVTGEDWFSDGSGYLWKNGEVQNLPPSSGKINELKSFFKDDEGNEYMCAEIITDNNDKIPVYWANGVESLMETTPPSSILFTNGSIDIYGMYVGNGDVYIIGNQRVGSDENLATLWKNGIIQPFTGDVATFDFGSVHVKDGDVFVAGYARLSNTETVAKYWKNGTPVDLFSDTNPAFAEAISVADNGDVYVVGVQFLAGQAQAVYWKNEERILLHDGPRESSASDIFIFGDDIYITGYGPERNGDAYFAYWKNGTPVTIPSREFRGGSWSLFVR
ncbi:hypothetical protein FGM00_16905 [Aggregatimonas sangjinii]|uniref:BIG2 domain-containing protein n=1 Tax=Aggregatimonas sangjinii TaxID=2583587 RepID=A0A5B7SWJ6_9FLAO|nr:Ig-like domain-containing protein [Aggregatimonas sangjinii]QCX01709.1 hypothetical protein FGM00_16905 [Aggregatimonas sangjinii]